MKPGDIIKITNQSSPFCHQRAKIIAIEKQTSGREPVFMVNIDGYGCTAVRASDVSPLKFDNQKERAKVIDLKTALKMMIDGKKMRQVNWPKGAVYVRFDPATSQFIDTNDKPINFKLSANAEWEEYVEPKYKSGDVVTSRVSGKVGVVADVRGNSCLIVTNVKDNIFTSVDMGYLDLFDFEKYVSA